ncbi:MAG TPA: FHA domain-containing protein [Planctomycetota bacterium]|nr:FHA domain-containing protein [Planctomycetota bacterium]
MIKLLVKFADESREVEIQETQISIGRATDNVLPLGDKKSSRKHARIEKVGDEYRINDLGSGNGTKVNGKDVNTHVLVKGDEIAIGLTTLFVLGMDTPPKVAPAPSPALAVTVAANAGVAPATSRHEERPASSDGMGEARRKQTRRAVARSSSNWAGTLVSVVVLAGIVGVGYHFYQKNEKDQAAMREAKLTADLASTSKVREAEAEFNKFKLRAQADPVEDSVIAEAAALAQTYGALYPQFDQLVSQLKQRRAEQIGRDDFATVNARVQGALGERRFGDALEALKDLKPGTEPALAGGLVMKVCDTINVEFKSIDDYGRKLADDKKYAMASDHYKLQSAKFKGTEHFKYLSYKPDNLAQLQKAEADTALVKGQPAPVEPPKPAEPVKPAPDTSLAKAEPAMPKEPPKPEPAMPAPAMPAPAMPKEMPKPPPAMPKETPKPPPPPPPKPPPAMPKEPEKKEMPADNKGPFKKPDVLCDCKKIVKGVFCVKCDRLLAQEDMRNGVCKRCEEKPKKIDMCVKRYFMVDGDPDSKSEKPIIKEGKVYDFPYEDKARITYLCEACGETGDTQYDVKHKPDCASKATIKVCSKSGTPPHGGEKK